VVRYDGGVLTEREETMTFVSTIGAQLARALPQPDPGIPSARGSQPSEPPASLRVAPTELAAAVQPAAASVTVVLQCAGRPDPDTFDNVPQPGDESILVDDWERPGPPQDTADPEAGPTPAAPMPSEDAQPAMIAWQHSLRILRGG